MNHAYTEWNHLSIRIKSLLEAGTYLFNALHGNSSDSYGALKKLEESSSDVYGSIKDFKENYISSLPKNVSECLDKFIRNNDSYFIGSLNKDGPKYLLVVLATLEAEISHYLSDTQAYIRKTVEIAFAHLQRQLVADKDLRKKWGKCQREEDFESLGAIHLLYHKIWAFKANTPGERTDLILSEPINTEDPLYKSVDGLVLTEWKVVRNKDRYEDKIKEAKKQAKIYGTSSLYPLELSNYRYLVLVSEKNIQINKDQIEFDDSGITYRVINIAYSPDVPSQESKKK